MISIYRLDRKLADVEVIGGKLHVVSYDGDWVNRLIEKLRPHVLDHHLLTDQELYDSLPERLQGMTWASLPVTRLGDGLTKLDSVAQSVALQPIGSSYSFR